MFGSVLKRKIKKPRDKIFGTTRYPLDFQFNSEVAEVFDDMIERSVPLYKEVIQSTVDWTIEFYQPGTKIFDIGCSTGTIIHSIAEAISQQARFVAIDTSQAMINKARAKLFEVNKKHEVVFLCENALDIDYSDASVVILNYTLQFIPINDRLKLLTRIREGLVRGGILFLSDKIESSSQEIQNTMLDLYDLFKLKNGYSRLEIERKKEALDNVLIPLTFDQQFKLLSDAGFKAMDTIIKWNNFASILCIKK